MGVTWALLSLLLDQHALEYMKGIKEEGADLWKCGLSAVIQSGRCCLQAGKVDLAFAPVFCTTNRATRPYVCFSSVIGLGGLLLYSCCLYVVCIDV